MHECGATWMQAFVAQGAAGRGAFWQVWRPPAGVLSTEKVTIYQCHSNIISYLIYVTINV